MANCNIVEFSNVAGVTSGSPIPAAQMPPKAVQNVTTSAVVANSAAFNDDTTIIRVEVNGRMSIMVDVNAVATPTNGLILESGASIYLGVKRGQRLSAIDA